LSSVILGVVGCQNENETAIKDQTAQGANIPPPATPPPKSQQEYFQRQKAQNPFNRSSGYPGARK